MPTAITPRCRERARRSGRIARERGDRLVERHPLRRIPTTRRIARRVLAGDRGVDAEQRPDLLDGKVRAADQRDVMIEHRPPRVRADDPIGADARLGPRHVAGRVGRLHRRDRVRPSTMRSTSSGAITCVCSIRKKPCARVRFSRGRERVEHAARPGVADRVDRDVPAARDRGFDRLRERRRLGDPQPAVAGIVGVRRASAARRASRAHRRRRTSRRAS